MVEQGCATDPAPAIRKGALVALRNAPSVKATRLARGKLGATEGGWIPLWRCEDATRARRGDVMDRALPLLEHWLGTRKTGRSDYRCDGGERVSCLVSFST